MSLHLQSNSIYTNQLNTDNFARMLKDPSQCYKFYWLEAILTLMETTEGDLSFDAIIDGPGLPKKVRINPHWQQLIFDNYPVIRSWIPKKTLSNSTCSKFAQVQREGSRKEKDVMIQIIMNVLNWEAGSC